MDQMSSMGEMPDFKTQITQAYEDPVLKPIVNERAELESRYLPTVFQNFQGGTGAADMSPAAKLMKMGTNLGQLTSKVGANQDIQNFYGMQIDNLARQQSENYNNRYSRLRDMYGMAFQREEAEKAAEARARSAAAQQAQMSNLQSLYGGQGEGGQEEGLSGTIGTPTDLSSLNAKRALSGSSAVDQNYFDNTWSKRQPKNLNALDHFRLSLDRNAGNAAKNMLSRGISVRNTPVGSIASTLRNWF